MEMMWLYAERMVRDMTAGGRGAPRMKWTTVLLSLSKPLLCRVGYATFEKGFLSAHVVPGTG